METLLKHPVFWVGRWLSSARGIRGSYGRDVPIERRRRDTEALLPGLDQISISLRDVVAAFVGCSWCYGSGDDRTADPGMGFGHIFRKT